MDLSALHPFLVTKNDANKLIGLAGELNDAIFTANFNLHELLIQNASYDQAQALETVIKQTGVSATDTKSLQVFFNNLQTELSVLPIVHIILAYSPKQKLMRQMHDWFYQNFKKTVILDISIDPTLVGGGIISFGGKANDYSLASKLEQLT